ncbi:MAG TPA: FAD-dependent oxidoreductase [Actinophytocola sp.]|jgi:cholesterol oxidase|uniref:FAD-dependent oxidoreductase n=1 Tax=Actinophytocola sp. TaxID=1872138 RepID=UPI002DF8B348|nr:FAD-dependent oxidoreductase [Actinophytocola sp.]
MEHERADVVVVGSGFGGSVVAYRLAAAGRSVVVLERGQPYPPGSFPRRPGDVSRAFWDPRAGRHGLYDVWSFGGCDAVVASGLGGGSLIYANVLLRKDEHWFVQEEPLATGGYESWPVTRAELDPHYEAVEAMLGAVPYPLEHPDYADTPKTIAMRDAAAELGLDWMLPPLAVSFAPSRGAEPGIGLPIVDAPYGNLHGVPRRTCRLCGECDMGCNDGSKNTLDHTYLSAARHHGADLRTMHEVREIRPVTNGGYEVSYVRHGPGPRRGVIRCDRLVLAAGTLGTTYLLMRNRTRLPGLSGTLGSRFSGNGDLLSFLLRAKDRSRIRPLDASHGPVITSAIRLADDVDGTPETGRGGYIEDGGHPAFVDWLIQTADVRSELGRAARFAVQRLRALVTHDTNLSDEVSKLVEPSDLVESSLPLLGMGRDVPDGRLRLRGGKLDVQWDLAASEPHFDRLRATMRRIADVLGAEHTGLPAWLGKRIITVHPLGGAPMGRHPGEGVCDAFGEVFDHPGLFIADGSVMPGPVGPNPSLTIAAFADRLATRLLYGAPVRQTVPVAAATGRTSLSFTEEMAGFIVLGASDPRWIPVRGRHIGDRLAFRLTIRVDDVDTFLGEPEHLARADGWLEASFLGGRCDVQRGWFNLLVPGAEPGSREMRYRLWFTDAAGQPRTLAGWKDVHDGPATRLWHDTSTLYARLLYGHVPPGEDAAARVAGAGTLHIQPMDLAVMLTSFRAEGPHGVVALARFGRFFVGQLWDVYGPG